MALCEGIHQWPVVPLTDERPIMQKVFPCHDINMLYPNGDSWRQDKLGSLIATKLTEAEWDTWVSKLTIIGSDNFLVATSVPSHYPNKFWNVN